MNEIAPKRSEVAQRMNPNVIGSKVDFEACQNSAITPEEHRQDRTVLLNLEDLFATFRNSTAIVGVVVHMNEHTALDNNDLVIVSIVRSTHKHGL